jgi:hypothetical protein
MMLRALSAFLAICAAGWAQESEVAVLGGACLAEGEGPNHAWYALVSRHTQEERRGDLNAAVETAKQIVRGKCSLEHWWMKLAQDLVSAGRFREAVDTLEESYNRHSNAVEERLAASGSPLRKLVSTPEYRRSALAARLRKAAQERRERIARAKERLTREPRPAEAYVAKKACPFECCAFGRWTAVEATVLYDKPGGEVAAGRVPKGAPVDALTGEVHLRPRPVRVRVVPGESFPAREGDVVFVLDRLGEGMGNVWYRGTIFQTFIAGVAMQCTFGKESCWGEFLEDGGAEDPVWWIQVKAPGGIVGWTREASHFTGADRCG